VTDDQIREKLREAFRRFALPRTMPGVYPVPKPEGFEAITINGGRGRLCSVCGELIPGNADGSFEFKYPDGRVLTIPCAQRGALAGGTSRGTAAVAACSRSGACSQMADLTLESRVRQWLRKKHAGTACCAECIAAARIKATAKAISLALPPSSTVRRSSPVDAGAAE
jgi:hypothetical protein